MRPWLAFMGEVMMLTTAAFLILFRPPGGGLFPRRLARSEHRTWWVAIILRLMATTIFLGGFLVYIVNLQRLETPIRHFGVFDITAGIIITLSGLVSIVWYAVFATYRKWERIDNE